MNILVLGWYTNVNIGDEAFRSALQTVVGEEHVLHFVPSINNIKNYDAIIVGGGSFLDQRLRILESLIDTKIPILFLGIGIHNKIYSDNKAWLEKATLIVCRNEYENSFKNQNVLFAPDLVFARTFTVPKKTAYKRLLILPNGFSVPKSDSPFWVKDPWTRFEQNMATVIDSYFARDWSVSIQPMCATQNYLHDLDDRQASLRLAHMSMNTEQIKVGINPISEDELLNEIAQADLVISGKYHGCIFSTILGRPFIGLSSHDKLLSYFKDHGWQNYLDYYFFCRDNYNDALNHIPSTDELENVRDRGRQQWDVMQDIVRNALSG